MTMPTDKKLLPVQKVGIGILMTVALGIGVGIYHDSQAIDSEKPPAITCIMEDLPDSYCGPGE